MAGEPEPEAATGSPPTEGDLPSLPRPSSPPPGAPEGETIEADDGVDPEDDGYGTEVRSTGSTSLSSSVRDYEFENNRRYHKFKPRSYHFPNDEPEQEREDMKHSMVVHLCGGKLHYAPIKNPQKVLDIGTGTGIWAIDMGDEYPEGEIIGIDLSPIQPDWVPPNVQFIVDDAEATWVWEPNSFDFIHLRNMSVAIKDWPKLLSQAYTALKPGGWIEIQEMQWFYGCDDDTMTSEYTPPQMVGNIKAGLAVLGIEMNAAEKNPERVEQAGFVNVENKVQKVPVGVWPKDKRLKTIGMYTRSIIYDGLQAITMGPYTRGLKWSPEEVEIFLVKVRKDLMDSSVHSYVYYHSLCGQKPSNN